MMKPQKSLPESHVRALVPAVLATLFVLGLICLMVEGPRPSVTCLLTSSGRRRPPMYAAARKHMEADSGFDPDACNVFDGEWVLDKQDAAASTNRGASQPPYYTESSCPYLSRQVTCVRNGRPDSTYQHWRWVPHGCELPRLDAINLLERLKNKRVVFVGDSVGRAQWESMVCILQAAVLDESRKAVYKVPPRKIFVALDYNTTVEFYWAPFLVESNSDHATKHRVQRRVVRLNSVAKHARRWAGADVLVFESYVWWMYSPKINATIVPLGGGGSVDVLREYDVPTAYRMALETWSDWVRSSVDPRKQRLFFVGLSPTHLWNWEWSGSGKRNPRGSNCFNETRPITKHSYWGAGSSLEILHAVEDTIRDLRSSGHRATLLNITQLSEYRKDGHTGVYGERRGELLTPTQRADPYVYADCVHWCLPGVPDTWNHILYAHLMYGSN